MKAVVGGVSSGIEAGTAGAMLPACESAAAGLRLVRLLWQMSLALRDRIGTWGDDQPTCYITSTGNSRPNYNGNTIRVMDHDGIVHDSFTAHQFRDHLRTRRPNTATPGRPATRAR